MFYHKFFKPSFSAEDIEIVEILERKIFNIREKKINNKEIRKYFNGELIGVSSRKGKPIYAFQELLFSLHKDLEKNSNGLFLIFAEKEVSLTAEEKNDLREKNQSRLTNKKKKVINLFYGSTHKPFSHEFYGQIEIPSDQMSKDADDYEIYQQKLVSLLKYFQKVDKQILIIASEPVKKQVETIFEDIQEHEQTLSIVKKREYYNNNQVLQLFNAIKPYKLPIFHHLVKLFSFVVLIFSIYFFFSYDVKQNREKENAFQKEIRDINRDTQKGEQELKQLQEVLTKKQITLKNRQATYKKGMNYDYR